MGSYKVCSVFTEHSLGLWNIKQKNFESHLNMENCIAFSERKSKQRAVIWTCSAVRWRVTSNAHRMACHCFKHNGSVCLGVAVFLRTLCSCKSKGMWILMGNSVSITTSTPERHGQDKQHLAWSFMLTLNVAALLSDRVYQQTLDNDNP